MALATKKPTPMHEARGPAVVSAFLILVGVYLYRQAIDGNIGQVIVSMHDFLFGAATILAVQFIIYRITRYMRRRNQVNLNKTSGIRRFP